VRQWAQEKLMDGVDFLLQAFSLIAHDSIWAVPLAILGLVLLLRKCIPNRFTKTHAIVGIVVVALVVASIAGWKVLHRGQKVTVASNDIPAQQQEDPQENPPVKNEGAIAPAVQKKPINRVIPPPTVTASAESKQDTLPTGINSQSGEGVFSYNVFSHDNAGAGARIHMPPGYKTTIVNGVNSKNGGGGLIITGGGAVELTGVEASHNSGTEPTKTVAYSSDPNGYSCPKDNRAAGIEIGHSHGVILHNVVASDNAGVGVRVCSFPDATTVIDHGYASGNGEAGIGLDGGKAEFNDVATPGNGVAPKPSEKK
jgi:hypothetical protein